jgi:hypothetical protein
MPSRPFYRGRLRRAQAASCVSAAALQAWSHAAIEQSAGPCQQRRPSAAISVY